MPDKYTYNIGGREWIQRPLVLGQWQQMIELLKGVAINTNVGVAGLIETLGSRLPLLMAVVLMESDGDLRKRFGLRYVQTDGVQVPEWYQNPDVMLEIANEIHAGIDAETTLKVVDDFLSCNPVSSILERLAGVLTITGQIRTVSMSMASSLSSPVSPEETLPSEHESSGDTPPGSASPT